MSSPFSPPPFVGRWPSFSEGFAPEGMEHGGISVGGIDVVNAVLGVDVLLHRPKRRAVIIGVDAVVVMKIMMDKLVNDGVEPLNHRFDGMNFDRNGPFLPRNSAGLAVEDDVPAKPSVLFALVGPKGAG